MLDQFLTELLNAFREIRPRDLDARYARVEVQVTDPDGYVNKYSVAGVEAWDDKIVIACDGHRVVEDDE